MKTVYYTQGTCSREIELEMEGDIVKSVRFLGGCHGNLQGIARLVEWRGCMPKRSSVVWTESVAE